MVKAMKRYNKEVTVIEMMEQEQVMSREELDRDFVEATTKMCSSTVAMSRTKKASSAYKSKMSSKAF